MQKKCIIVKFKKDCSYVDVAKQISENASRAWIYIHTELLEKLIKDNESHLYVIDKKTQIFLLWQPTDEIDYVSLKLKSQDLNETWFGGSWAKVVFLNNENFLCDDPQEILFFKLEK